MLDLNNTALLVIDVQGKLAGLMHEQALLFSNLRRLIGGAQVLDLPMLITEQVPEKLGPTRPELLDALDREVEPIAKTTFSCCGNETFMDALDGLQRRQILVTGIETHICVYQTSVDLVERGYEVQLVTDAVSSRVAENRDLGINRINAAGATLTSTEMALFELLRIAEGPKFREIAKIVK